MTENFGGFFDAMTGGGGNGAPGFDWDGKSEAGVGRSVHGEIVDLFKSKVTDINTKEPKLDKNGNTMPELVVTLQTDLRDWQGVNKIPVDKETNQPKPASEDTGLRRVYLRYEPLRILGAAVLETGTTLEDFFKGVNDGSKLALKRIPSSTQMLNFEIRYKKGSGVQADGFEFGNAAPAEPAAPAAPAPADSPWGASSSSDEPPF